MCYSFHDLLFLPFFFFFFSFAEEKEKEKEDDLKLVRYQSGLGLVITILAT